MRQLMSISIAALLCAGCGGETSPGPAAKSAPAAKVTNARAESDLTTITLSDEAERHLALTIAEASIQPVTSTRTLGGEVMVPTGQALVIAAPVAGTLSVVSPAASTGGAVAKGSVLFELLPLQPADRDTRISADRAVNEANVRLSEAAQRLQRLETLLKEGSASTRAVEEARANHDVAKAAADAAGRQLAAIGRLSVGPRGELAILAPFDAHVTALHAVAGQAVPAGASLADIADLRHLWLRVPVFAGDVASIDRRQPAMVTELGRESTGPWRTAQPIAAPPTATASAASIDLVYELNSSGRRPGERVAVRLALTSADAGRAIVVPASAVVYDLSGGTWVYEAKGNHVFTRRRVEISGPAGSGLIVRRGLTAGVRLVTVGAAELYGTEFYVNK